MKHILFSVHYVIVNKTKHFRTQNKYDFFNISTVMVNGFDHDYS